MVAAFVSAWNGCGKVKEIASTFGLAANAVMVRACLLRNAGHTLRARRGRGAMMAPASVTVLLADEHRGPLARACEARNTTGFRLVNDLVASMLDDTSLLDAVLDDEVTTPAEVSA